MVAQSFSMADYRAITVMLTLLVLAVFTSAQSAPGPPAAILELRRQGGERLGQASRFACELAIERVQEKRSEGIRIEERARLEVAYAEGKEQYSWPGEASFRDDELREILVMGLSGAGSFAAHLRSVVLGTGTEFGDPVEGAGGAVAIPYRVPAEKSGYLVNVDGKEIEAAIEGTITLAGDANGRRLSAFTLRAVDLPADFAATAVSESVTFVGTGGNVTGGAVPSRASQKMVERGTDEYTNEIQFENCREFRGEASVRFDGEVSEGGRPEGTAGASPRPLPEGVPIDLELKDGIDWGKRKTGDVIEAELSRDVRWKGRLLVEEGATARGRIVELKKLSGKSTGFLVGLSFDEIVDKKTTYPVRLGLESMPEVLKGPRRGIAAMVLGEEQRFRLINRIAPSGKPYPGGGFFQVSGEKLDVPKGFALRWVVERARP